MTATTAPPTSRRQSQRRQPTSLPPLPNVSLYTSQPTPLLSLQITEAQRALAALGNGASSGTSEYPYPSNFEYPLVPLPPVPVAPKTERIRRYTSLKTESALVNPPIPASSPLSSAQTLDSLVSAYNSAYPSHPAVLRYDQSAILIKLADRGWVWAFIRTLIRDDDAQKSKILGVRYYPAREKPPPVHTLPPSGPAQVLSEHLSGLHLSVPALLYRLPHISTILDAPCNHCGRHLSDADGLPVSSTGFLVTRGKNVLGSGEGSISLAPQRSDTALEGRWVGWHISCEI